MKHRLLTLLCMLLLPLCLLLPCAAAELSDFPLPDVLADERSYASFADFAEANGEIYDIRCDLYNADGVEIAEVLLTNPPGFSTLTGIIQQNGSLGWEVLPADPAKDDAAAARLRADRETVIFMHRGETERCTTSQSPFPTDSAPQTMQGVSDSYRVYASATVTLRFLYVRDGDAWRHTYTTNSLYIDESHSSYTVTVQDGRSEGDMRTTPYAIPLTTEGFDARHTAAIAALQQDAPVVDLLSGYTLSVLEGEEELPLFTLAVPMPQALLDSLPKGDNFPLVPVLAIGAVLAVGFLHGIVILQRKKKE